MKNQTATKVAEIKNKVYNVGVNDYETDLFEGQYKVPNGMRYNSYLIDDKKVCVMDTVDERFGKEWLDNIESVLGDREPDYLVILHVEPDHSASITRFIEKYPSVTVAANSKAFAMIDNFYGFDLVKNRLIVENGGSLDLGSRSLTFVSAPMVHWPEVFVAYDREDKILFSADAFGTFGAVDDKEFSPQVRIDEARRYYIGIVGKFGAATQTLLKKATALDIEIACSLHGPVLRDELAEYIRLYDVWSSYGVEKEGVLIAYSSVYGHTADAATLLADRLREKGVSVEIFNLARDDMSDAVAKAFAYGKVVLATTTYNAGIFPVMREFINELVERNFKGRKVGFIENGSWVPMAKKIMFDKLSVCKDITFAQNSVTILSALTEKNKEEINALAEELASA